MDIHRAVTDSECRIDSLAHSWSVMAQPLIRTYDDLVLLRTPPFGKMPRDPGCIEGHLPGVRENGGHYTRAAAWCVIAYAMLADGDRTGDLFNMLNPINHAATRAGVETYKVEPYVSGRRCLQPADVVRNNLNYEESFYSIVEKYPHCQ